MADNAKTASAIFREARKNRERLNKFIKGELLGQVLSISGFNEHAQVLGFPTDVVIQHPFLSSNAWIRGLPELGTPLMAKYNEESNEAIHTGYRNMDPTDILAASAEGNGLYIELIPGEIDVMSKGMNHHFLTARPYDIRESGLVQSILDGDSSTFINKAVTFIDYLHQNEVATIKDTRIFGVVRRNKNSVETKIIRAPISEQGLFPNPLEKVGFAKEFTTILNSKERVLLDYREGHVIDDDGSSPVSDWTGNNLRIRKQVFNTSDEATKIEIDNLGNVDIIIPDDAESGIRLDVVSGSIEATIGNEISITSEKNSLYKANGNSTFTIECGYLVNDVNKDITIDAGGHIVESSKGNTTLQAEGTSTMTVGGFLTNLGQEGKASHPLLFGDTFIQSFLQFLVSLAAHVHPGISVPSPDLATACIQLASDCPNFVSMNVQTQ
jgi:hypothetical protein